tara:strand:+ start:1037 stop:1381 length:345 start_codon:yes stop_codon:yes gene_type:complete
MISKDYYKFKELLHAGEEDRSLAMELLNNTQPSLVIRALLGKSLDRNFRLQFFKKFPEVKLIVGPWNDMFDDIKNLNPTIDEKKLFEKEMQKSVFNVINEHYPIIKNMNVKLKW